MRVLNVYKMRERIASLRTLQAFVKLNHKQAIELCTLEMLLDNQLTNGELY